MKGFDPRGKTLPEHRLLALPDKSSRPSAQSADTAGRSSEMIPLPPKTLPPEPEPAVAAAASRGPRVPPLPWTLGPLFPPHRNSWGAVLGPGGWIRTYMGSSLRCPWSGKGVGDAPVAVAMLHRAAPNNEA